MPDFIPARDSDLVTWSTNFDTRITAAPTTFGLTAAQATAYDALHDAFVAAYNAAANDGSNSTSAIITKNDARVSLVANARLLAAIVQAHPGTTNTMRSDLGLTVRDAAPTPVPPPADAPSIVVVSTSGNTVRVRIIDPANPTRRGKPAGVDGIALFSFVGAAAPTDEAAWKFEGNTTQTAVNVIFPNTTAPGAKVWFTAFYFNQRKQSGPPATPVSTNIAGGGAMAA